MQARIFEIAKRRVAAWGSGIYLVMIPNQDVYVRVRNILVTMTLERTFPRRTRSIAASLKDYRLHGSGTQNSV